MSSSKRKRDSEEQDEFGDNILSLRIMASSRDQYSTIIKRFCEWLKSNNPLCVIDDEIVLPLPVNVCKAFLAYSSLKRCTNGEEIKPYQHNSFSTINGIRSAIKYLYKEANKTVNDDLDSMMTGKIFTKDKLYRV
jgi:hypothetical protein